MLDIIIIIIIILFNGINVYKKHSHHDDSGNFVRLNNKRSRSELGIERVRNQKWIWLGERSFRSLQAIR